MLNGDELRDNGIARADQAASPPWKKDVDDVIHWLAVQQRELTTEEVWDRLEKVSKHTTRENRAMGARMQAAQKKGWIEITNSFRNTGRRSRHSAPVRVWRSRIYRVKGRREHL